MTHKPFFNPDSDPSWLMGRLLDTVIMYDGKLVSVVEITGEGIIVARRLGSSTTVRFPHTDPKARYGLPRLGYGNVGPNAILVSRMPLRRWKQGLDTRGITMWSPYSGRVHSGFRNLSTALLGIHQKDYPSYSEAVAKIANLESLQSIAFSPQWAITQDRHVFLRRVKVGVSLSRNTITLDGEYSFLSDELDRKGINCEY